MATRTPSRRTWAAAVTLVLVSSVVPELFTGNTPWWRMIEPGVFATLLACYGLPVLALRELSVRLGTGPLGLIVSGLGYGLLNEGLLAKTIFRTHIPMDAYSGYATAFGVAWPWLAFILSWHAVASVALPVAVTHAVFPRIAQHAWTPRWAPPTLAAPILIIGVAAFTLPTGEHLGTPAELIIVLATMAALVAVSTRVRSRWRPGRPPLSLATGAAGLVAVAGLAILAGIRAWPPLWLLAWVGLVAIGWLGTRRGAATWWLAGGFYGQTLILPLLTGGFLPH